MVALTRPVTNRKRRHLKVFVPFCYFSVDHVDADSQQGNVKLMSSLEHADVKMIHYLNEVWFVVKAVICVYSFIAIFNS